MHVPLFELRQLVCLNANEGLPQYCRPSIQCHAWRQHQGRSVLALAVDTGCLLLWSQVREETPQMGQIPWPGKEGAVVAMAFSDDGSWLLVVTEHHFLLIIPALAVLGVATEGDITWPNDDITRWEILTTKGAARSAAWWRMMSGEHVGIIGMEDQTLLFIDLHTGDLVFEQTLAGIPQTITLFVEPSPLCTYVVSINQGGVHNKFLLEQEMGVTRVEHSGRAGNSLGLLPAGDGTLSHDQTASQMSCQYAWGRHLVAALSSHEQVLRVYDSLTGGSTFYEYVMPRDVDKLLMVDQMMFLTAKNKITIHSNHASLITYTETTTKLKDCILQEFTLPESEKIISVERWATHTSNWETSTRAFYDHSRLVGIMPSSTALDGCLVTTEHGVYHCKQRIPPEDLFVQLVLKEPSGNTADMFGKMVGLNSQHLCEVAALALLQDGAQEEIIMDYFHKARTPLWKQACSLAQYSYQEKAISILDKIWKKQEEVPDEQWPVMANLKVKVTLELRAKGHGQTDFCQELCDFLLENRSYNVQDAFSDLVAYKQYEMLFTVTKTLGLYPECVEALIGHGNTESGGLEQLLVNLLPNQLLSGLLAKPDLIPMFLQEAAAGLEMLQEDQLLLLLQVLDPSKYSYCVIQAILMDHTEQLQMSMTSLNSDQLWGQQGLLSKQLVEILIYGVLLRLKQQGHRAPCIMLNKEPLTHKKDDLAYEDTRRDQSVSCGRYHSAAVVSGVLYTWGCPAHGRLGHGQPTLEPVTSPLLVASLLHVRVLSVSCGTNHTIARTENGLYGWGSSKYGQVGCGLRQDVLRPVMIDSPDGLEWREVSCGQYHTLALMDSGSVYSWGWGVFGQLGRGSPEDSLTPELVCLPSEVVITQVAAGYAHSLMLSSQGDVYASGLGKFGQIGKNSKFKVLLPQQIDLEKQKIVAVATSFFHNLALTEQGDVLSFGTHPRLFSGMKKTDSDLTLEQVYEQCAQPLTVDLTNVCGQVQQICCGERSSMLRTKQGLAYAWGQNLEGQLGIGSRQKTKKPKLICNTPRLCDVTCGAEHALTFDLHGKLWSWGCNKLGQVGVLDKVRSSADPGRRHSPVSASGELGDWCPDPDDAPSHVPSEKSSFVFPQMVNLNNCPQHQVTEDFSGLQGYELDQFQPEIICLLIKSLPGQLSLPMLLGLCEKYEAWDIAADVSFLHQLYTESCHYMLEAMASMETGPAKEVAEKVLTFIHILLRAIHGACYDEKEEFSRLEDIFDKVFTFWNKKQLDHSQLESFLQKLEAFTVGPLCSALFGHGETDWTGLFSPAYLLATMEQMYKKLQHGQRKETSVFSSCFMNSSPVSTGSFLYMRDSVSTQSLTTSL